jgi:hypothetical protein
MASDEIKDARDLETVAETDMRCIEVEEAVARMFGIRQNLIVPNIFWSLFRYEIDLLVVRPSGYAVEVEIKVSKYDLKKDALKRHQHIDHKDRIKELYFAVPEKLVDAAIEYAPADAGIIAVEEGDKTDSFFKPYWNKAKIVRPSVKRKTARPLTEAETNYVARLGTMRIWGLKEKLIAATTST